MNRDDTAVLVTLTARELSPNVRIVASVRESENVHLLRQSGASSVVVSAETAGRLLGMATTTPSVVEVVEDLLTPDAGFAISEREVEDSEVGGSPRHLNDIVLGVVRDGQLHRVDASAVDALEQGDRLLYVRKASPPPRTDAGRVASPGAGGDVERELGRRGCPGCCPGWTSARRTSSACRRPSCPTRRSPTRSPAARRARLRRTRTTAGAVERGRAAVAGRARRRRPRPARRAALPDPRPPADARAVSATCAGLRVTSVYVPNGRTPDDPHYALQARLARRAARLGRPTPPPRSSPAT